MEENIRSALSVLCWFLAIPIGVFVFVTLLCAIAPPEADTGPPAPKDPLLVEAEHEVDELLRGKP